MQAYKIAASHMENKDHPKIPELSKVIKAKKREALTRDERLCFSPVTPNAALARVLIAATRGMKEVIGPAIDAHHAYLGANRSDPPPANRGGEGGGTRGRVTVETLIDSGATHPMADLVTCKQAGIPIDAKQASDFTVADCNTFKTAGVAAQPIPFHIRSTDNEKMTLNAQKVHAADLGGSKGESEAKNLLDVVKTLVLGMGLTLVFGPNEHGNWGGQLIDLAKGMASAIPLNEDMLPCLQLDGGPKLPYVSVPDSFAKLSALFAEADKKRALRLSGRSFVTTETTEVKRIRWGSRSPSPPPQEAMPESDQELYNDWLDKEWEADQAANKLQQRKQAPRTVKNSHVYPAQAMHNVLHRSAEETVKAFNHPDVKFTSGDGTVKRGDELTVKDLQIGSCSVCKQVRAVAPTRHDQGQVNWACEGCTGTAFPAVQQE